MFGVSVYHVTEEGWVKLGLYDALDLHHQYENEIEANAMTLG